jgi:tRNA pseudouridine38-40 synthase
MPSYKITLAYDGTDFIGWQRQATGTSVQGLIEDALREFGDGDIAVSGAGRTDAGVHALAQVASFALVRAIAPDVLVRALNAKLPDAVRVTAAEQVPASFHARFDARRKTYRYRIWNADVLPPFERRYAWHVPGGLDVVAMRQAAAIVEGIHNFAAFQSAGSDVATTTRHVYRSTLAADGALLVYETVADGFLRHMVRALAGSLVEVGRGRETPDWFTRVLDTRQRSAAGRTAPAHGLFLVGVDYPDALAAER